MLRREAFWFTRLGSVIERADNTARLLRRQILSAAIGASKSAVPLDRRPVGQSSRPLGPLGLPAALTRGAEPWLVADMLIFRPNCRAARGFRRAETVDLLPSSADRTGRQGEADRLARRAARIRGRRISTGFPGRLHGNCGRFIAENAAIDAPSATISRFG